MKVSETALHQKIRKCANTEYNRNIGSPFYECLVRCRDFVDQYEPVDYDTWKSLDHQFQAASLYITFYDEIVLSYYKARSYYSPEEDNVSIVLQYLEKNVKILMKDRKRYKANYIYRVCYNCIFCQSRGIKRDLERYENEMSPTVVSGGEVYNVFDYLSDTETVYGSYNKEHLWRLIESLGEDAVHVAEYLISGNRLPAGVKAKMPKIIDQIRTLLLEYIDIDQCI